MQHVREVATQIEGSFSKIREAGDTTATLVARQLLSDAGEIAASDAFFT